ncbi:MAG: hypothetical protein ABSF56_02630 [Minisyncoccia bacterium]|jgi:hypothetical protein
MSASGNFFQVIAKTAFEWAYGGLRTIAVAHGLAILEVLVLLVVIVILIKIYHRIKIK